MWVSVTELALRGHKEPYANHVRAHRVPALPTREFPKIRGTLVWGPYNKDPTISGTIVGSPIF